MERVKKFFAPPVFEDSERTRQAYMLNLVTLLYLFLSILAVGSLLGVYADRVRTNDTILFTLSYRVGPFLLAIGLGQLLLHRRRVRAGSIAFVSILWTGYTVSIFLSGSVFSTEFAYYFLVLLMAGLLLGTRATLVILGLSIVASGISVVLYLQGILPSLTINDASFVSNWASISIGLMVTALVLYLFVRQIQESEGEVQETNRKLEEARQALEVQVNVKTRGLELAGEVGRELAYERNLDRLLEKAVNTIQRQFDLYYVQIYLADVGQHRLVLRAGTGDVGDALVARGHRLAFGTGSINGAAAATQEPIVVSDTTANPLFRPNVLLPDTKAEMAIPLVAGDRVVGVLNIQSNVAYGLSTEDFDTFNALAGQLAIAIENANLFAEVNAAQQRAEEGTKRSTRENWEAYLDAIAHHERFGYSFDGLNLNSAVVEADEKAAPIDDGLVVPIIVNGELIGSIQVETDDLEDTSKVMINAVAQQVAQQSETLRLLADSERYRDEAERAIRRLTRESWEAYETNLVTHGYEYDQDVVRSIGDVGVDEGTTAVLRHAIEIHGESIGELEVFDVESNSVEAEALLASITAVLSAHIENLRLSEQTEIALSDSEKRGADLDLINRVVSLATESLDLDYTLQAIADELGESLDYARVSISLIDILRNSFTVMAEYVSGSVEQGMKGMTFSLDGASFVSEVIRSQKPLMINNIASQGPATAPAMKMLQTMGIDGFAMLPMVVGQVVIGTLSISSKTSEGALNENDMQLLQTMIRQIATAVQNARLFAETQQRARRDQILNEITARVYTAVDADSILQTAVKEINRQLGLETYVYLDEDVELEPQAENGSNGHQS